MRRKTMRTNLGMAKRIQFNVGYNHFCSSFLGGENNNFGAEEASASYKYINHSIVAS